jgi:ATP-dependent DNA helicase RecG
LTRAAVQRRAAARSPKASAADTARSTAGVRDAQLVRLGLRRDWDFALHLPLRYEDETRTTPIAELEPGQDALVQATVVSCEVQLRSRRQLVARLRDADGATMALRFLHFYPSHQKQLAPGREVRAFGAVRGGLLGVEMVHPRITVATAATALPQQLTPIYPTAAGVSQNWLRAHIAAALRALDMHETLPPAERERLGLVPLADALRALHGPPPSADVAAWSEREGPLWRRVRFDEALAQQLSLRIARGARRRLRAPPLAPASEGLVERLLAALPFRLTSAQQRVWHDVAQDLAEAVPMHRLVQGDVGSGKTVIAALAAVQAVAAGYQVALMAPTEILAEQHFRRIADWLVPLGVPVLWLVGRLTAKEKRAAQAAAQTGEPGLIVGTHALVQEAVTLPRLGLAIVDEQHRFGVLQRLALRDRGGAAGGTQPHLLMLSATPIPRTLAMSYLADLDVSVIDELPPGRSPIVTKLVSASRRADLLARVRDEAAHGRQVYWVCPLVEEGTDESTADLTAATRMFEETAAALPELRLGLLHGQLAAREKSAVMEGFAAGQIDVLVATTVIEVGVDVANASLMVIEHAQRFGLAQLHQLRGRVGRGARQSYCVLLYDEALSELARARLRTIYETTDGFEVARRDLQLRGPGEFLGSRQSGVPLLRFVDLERDAQLIEEAGFVAQRMLQDDPAAARRHVERWFGGREELLDA